MLKRCQMTEARPSERDTARPDACGQREGAGGAGASERPSVRIAFTDPAHPGSDESQADKHRRHKQMRGPLRAAGFQVPAPDEEGLASTARLDTGHTLCFLPYGDHTICSTGRSRSAT